jgi:inward rectifier potassium channel
MVVYDYIIPTMARRAEREDIEVVNAERQWWHDLYHSLISASWLTTLLFISAVFLLINLLFALGYLATGGIAEAHDFSHLFYFAVETSATIGYGYMHPVTQAAHLLMSVQAVVSVLIAALTTGIVFTKFSIPRALVQFAEHPVIAPYEGVPTLQFRIGNQRESRLIEAMVRAVVLRTERTREGILMYRMHDLKLMRDRSPALARSWLVLHIIDESSPLYPPSPEMLEKFEMEFILTLIGTDEVSAQAQHAQVRYKTEDVRWGVRHADMLSELPDGRVQLDMSRFNELVEVVLVEESPNA